MNKSTLVPIALLWCAGLAAAAPPREPTPMLAQAAPPAGVYDAQLCVAVGAAATQCGPVVVELGPGNFVWVVIGDVVYRLQTENDQLGVTLFHGTMQIDGFFAGYRWADTTLQFSDVEKNTRYEVKLGTRRFAP
jgi:hypothetical protein